MAALGPVSGGRWSCLGEGRGLLFFSPRFFFLNDHSLLSVMSSFDGDFFDSFDLLPYTLNVTTKEFDYLSSTCR